jgi:hypothetical protein
MDRGGLDSHEHKVSTREQQALILVDRTVKTVIAFPPNSERVRMGSGGASGPEPYDSHTSQPGQGFPGSRLAIGFSSASRGSSFARGRLSVGHEGARDIGVRSHPCRIQKARTPTRRNQGGPRSSRSRKQWRSARSAAILVYSVNAVVLPVSSVLKTLTSCPSERLPRRSVHIVGPNLGIQARGFHPGPVLSSVGYLPQTI